MIDTAGHRRRIRSTIFATCFTEPAAASMSAGRSLARNKCSPQKSKRQVAVVVVVAVKEPARLMAVDRIVGGVKIEHDSFGADGAVPRKSPQRPPRWHGYRPRFSYSGSPHRPDWRQFQPIQRALARQRLAAIFGTTTILAGRIGLSHQDGQERVMAESVVVVEVFVAQGQSGGWLGQQLVDGVFDQFGIAVVGETGGQPTDDAGLGLDLPQEESAGVRGNGPAIESGGDFPVSQGLEIKLAPRYTLLS